VIDPSLLDVVLPRDTGYPPELQAEDTRDALMMAASEAGITVVEFPKHLWIEPRHWREAALEAKEAGTRPIDFMDRFTNQGPGPGIRGTHECTCHSLIRAWEATWNRQRRIKIGPPVPRKRLDISAMSASVWLSCISVYAEANPGQWGGASVRQVLQIMGRRGALPDKIQPKDYAFKHQLHGTCGAGGINQSRGEWVSVSRFPAGWEATAAHFKPLECVFPEIWEQIICLEIHGFAVMVGREGHAVPLSEYLPDDEASAYPDSYDVIRYDSISRTKRSVSGACAIVSTVVPDDWSQPAGTLAA
jgi:hypothetical protein